MKRPRFLAKKSAISSCDVPFPTRMSTEMADFIFFAPAGANSARLLGRVQPTKLCEALGPRLPGQYFPVIPPLAAAGAFHLPASPNVGGEYHRPHGGDIPGVAVGALVVPRVVLQLDRHRDSNRKDCQPGRDQGQPPQKYTTAKLAAKIITRAAAVERRPITTSSQSSRRLFRASCFWSSSSFSSAFF